MSIKKFTIGSDPEGWIISKLTNQSLPIIGILGGEKGEPIEFLPGFGYQEDNCSWEFNIPPSNTKREFIENMQIALAELSNVLEDYSLVISPSIEFHPDLLKSKKATEIGCSEDFNAYTMEIDKIPNLAITNKRYAGGHIHIGWENSHWLDAQVLVKYLDLYLGVPAVILDKDTERKSIYGTAGRFRPKDYGLEYRTLSNFWIVDEKTISFVYDQVEKAISNFNQYKEIIDNSSEEIIECINTNNAEKALELINKFNVCSIQELEEIDMFVSKYQESLLSKIPKIEICQ